MVITYTVSETVDMAKSPGCFAKCCVAVNVGGSN